MPKPLPIVWHLDTNAIEKHDDRKEQDRLTRIAIVMENFEKDGLTRKQVKEQIEAIVKS